MVTSKFAVMFDYSPNLWAVVGAAVVSMVLGALWYSPALFGKTWAPLTGHSPDSMSKGETNRSYVVIFVAALVITYALASVIFLSGAVTLTDSFVSAFWLWLGFVATVLASAAAYSGQKFRQYLIDAGFYLVSFLVMGGIFYYYP